MLVILPGVNFFSFLKIIYSEFFVCFPFLRWHLQHMEVSGQGVELKLQLQAYITATEMTDPSHICDLCCSLRQCQIPNPLSEARDWTHILTDTMLGFKPLGHIGNSYLVFCLYLNFRIFKNIFIKNVIGLFIGIALNTQIALGSMNLLKMSSGSSLCGSVVNKPD